MEKSVAAILLDTAQAAGASHVYGMTGESTSRLTEALQAHPALRFVEVRHQETAAFAAGAEANISSRLAVCIGSCGPGSVQLLNGLYDCHRSRLPVLAIAAQVPAAEIGSGVFQEIHPQLLFRECSHFCEQISVPAQAVRLAEAAVHIALSRGGVSVLVVPADVLGQLVADAPTPRVPALGHASAIVPASDKIAEAAALLNDCERVTILAGSGIKGAHAELLQAAQALMAPVVHSLAGKECVQPSNPYDVGQSGEPAMLAARQALREADGILLLGNDYPFGLLDPPTARIAQTDKHAEHLGRRLRVEVGLHGTTAETLQKLLPHLRPRPDSTHLRAAQRQYQADLQQLTAQATGQSGDPALRPQLLTQRLSVLAPDDTIFTCDVGMPLLWAGRYLHMNGHRRLINSFVHGSAGAALPQALGAAAAVPGRVVVALCGDGGLAMLLGELLTLRQQQLPVKVIIYNNGSNEGQPGVVGAEQPPALGPGLLGPDYARLAETMGLRGLRVSDPARLDDVLREAFAYPGPVVVDAVVYDQQPPEGTPRLDSAAQQAAPNGNSPAAKASRQLTHG